MKMTVGMAVDVMNMLATNAGLFEKAEDGIDSQIEGIEKLKASSGYSTKIQEKISNLLSATVAGSDYELKFYAEQLSREDGLNDQLIKLREQKSKVIEYGGALTVILENQAENFIRRLCGIDPKAETPDRFSEFEKFILFAAEAKSKKKSGLLKMIKVDDIDQTKALIGSLVSILESAKKDGVLHVVNGIDFAKEFLSQLDKYQTSLSSNADLASSAHSVMFKPVNADKKAQAVSDEQALGKVVNRRS